MNTMKSENKNFIIKEVRGLAEIMKIMKLLGDNFYTQTVDIDKLSYKLSKYGVFKVAAIDDVISGFVGYYANDSQEKIGYLTTITVASQYRGKGVGGFLLRECLNDCRTRGMNYCKLEVHKDNFRAIHMYNKFGFYRLEEATECSDYYICKL